MLLIKVTEPPSALHPAIFVLTSNRTTVMDTPDQRDEAAEPSNSAPPPHDTQTMAIVTTAGGKLSRSASPQRKQIDADNPSGVAATPSTIAPPTAPRVPRTLLTLPTEVLSDILLRASTHDEPIAPEQWLTGSLEFAHGSPWIESSAMGAYRHPAPIGCRLNPALSAVEVAKTCKTINKIVSEDHLMYKANKFEFRSMKEMLTYLVAISPERRDAIKSVRVFYDYQSDPAAALTILSACKGLRYLELDTTIMSNFFKPNVTAFDQAPGYAELINFVAFKLT